MPRKPVMLNETGEDIAAALWGLGAILRERSELSFRQMKDVIIGGAGPKIFPVGTTFFTVKGNYSYPWAFMHHGNLPDGRPYADIRVIRAVNLLQFDSQEAFYYCENQLAAGTYYFNVPTAYGQCAAGNYQFTLNNIVPAGGRLSFAFVPYSNSPVGRNVNVYDAANSAVVSQTATISSGNSGTNLGLLQAGGDPDVANMNSIQRACFGSNNYAQSAVHQYLNSNKAAGTYWSSTNRFDNQPSWQGSEPGFMSKLPDDFLDIVSPVDIQTVTNTVFETDGYTKSSSYSLRAMFWLPSRYQIFGSTEGADLSETQWDYYKGATDVDRIMYDNGGSARGQWLRTPHTGYAFHPRIVYITGALGNNYAYNSNAVAPACRIYARGAV